MSLEGQRARLKKYQERLRTGQPLPLQVSKDDVLQMEKDLAEKPLPPAKTEVKAPTTKKTGD